jgi:membrane-associated phospholipid phosphatase
MKQPQQRWYAMLLGWGCVGPVYHTLGAIQRSCWVVPETAFDRAIPFDPAGIWLYLSFFILVPLAYLRCPPERLRWLMRAFQLCALSCAFVFLLWPTTLQYPAIPNAGGNADLLRLLTRIDSAQNCLPSLHGALGMLAVWALWQRDRPWRSLAIVFWCALILFAAIQTRRHLLLDLTAGLALGAACGWMSQRLATRPAT